MLSDPILICDPAPLMLEGLSAILRTRANPVKTTTDLLDLASMIQEIPGAVVVVSADFNPSRLIWFMKSQANRSRMLLIVTPGNEEALRMGLNNRVCGYIDRTMHPADYLEAIDSIMRGHAYVCHSLEGAVAKMAVEAELSKRSTLTPREMDVLRLVAEGKSSKTVAEYLAISRKTVEFHRSRLFAKLGVHSSVELVSYAFSLGLLGERIAEHHRSEHSTVVGGAIKFGQSNGD